MSAVHLCVMKLERQLQRRFEKSLVISAPDNKRIIENAAIHTDSSVDFGVHDGGCTDNHTVDDIIIFATFGNLFCKAQIIGIESHKVI